MKGLIYSIMFYVLGMLTLSFGVTMLILSDLGVGAWDALFVGLSNLIGFTVGTWIFTVGILLIILNKFLLRSKFDYSAILTIFLIGVFIDFWLLVIFDGVVITDMAVRVGLLGLGVLGMGAGIGMYLQLDFARNPIDNLMMAVHYRTGLSIAMSKSGLEIVVLIIAFVIGGPIGIGTIIVAFGIGPLVQLFFKQFAKIKSILAGEAEPNA
ncbi:putative membrane protein YczE [Alkalibacillus filiformis]|uniref:Membrane protein YczE n=1 Tax=Alkalibacillus filiformis TaxID=200990 RepID=A0ABU0DUT7_9BACI|nr:membrane protein [Alkalibacillus filiformis]MDQ0352222.1 putative membrane protein YczE [Alkalibacillus filiformis]